MMKQTRRTASQFQTTFKHSQIVSDILGDWCRIFFVSTMMLIEDFYPPPHQWEH